MLGSKLFVLCSTLLATAQGYWLSDMKHQGLAPYAGANFPVYRNVRDYGARGDGTTDDTAAINAAISAGGTCGRGCIGTTTKPALIFFPSGTYLLSSPINPAYLTQLIGDPNNLPVLKATANFGGFGVIDGDPYYTQSLNWGSTTVFYRQVRNFVIDTTNIPPQNNALGMHWPTAQATSLQNIVFNLASAANTVHVGLFIEEGSAGFMSDLTFNGGNIGAQFGNQQFTMRNLNFNNCKTAIQQLWSWGWTYVNLNIKSCGVGIDMSSGGSSSISTGSITLIDSSIRDTPVGINTARTGSSSPAAAGSLIIENVDLVNVPVAVKGPSGTLLNGGTTKIAAWGSGNRYVPNGPTKFQENLTPVSRPSSLVSGGRYYQASKPQYNSISAANVVSARSSGARGDGNTDDTAALQNAINSAASAGKVFFLDHGMYVVTDTITIPPGAKIVGEAYPTIISSGSKFSNVNSPRAVVKVGATSGQSGTVQIMDFIVSTRGAQGGATLIEWNLASPDGSPSGMWDVHTRVGGFQGSNLSAAQCAKQPGNSNVRPECVAAFMSMHVTTGASGLYMENCWLWVADHDIDTGPQIDIFAGRGLLIESTKGNIWLVGTASEHHVLYQYNLVNTQNIFAGQVQTETPYFQPTPAVPNPFSIQASLNDPTFPSGVKSAYGLRIKNSKHIFGYGVGLYSFFSSWSTACDTIEAGATCQPQIASVESSSDIVIYNLNTVGVGSMINLDGTSKASFKDNVNDFTSTIALFRPA